jgi:hypothetical protein
MRTTSLLFLAALVAACGTRSVAPTASYGTDFPTPPRILPANKLLAMYSEAELLDTVTTTLSGTVNEVCQAKGCWMTLAVADDQEMMVKFRDYAFFVPKDLGSEEVVLHGKAYYQVTPVDELRHYAEDAGKSPEEIAAITEPKQELRFLADGVQVR